MNSAPLLSVIVVTFNQTKETFAELFSTLRGAPADRSEIVIVDNASQEPVREGLRAFAASNPSVRLVENSSNEGFGIACNRAAGVARGSVLFFLNPDCTISETSWERVLESSLEIAQGRKAVVQPLVLRQGDGRIDTAGELLFSGGGATKLAEGLSVAEAKCRESELQACFDSGLAGPSGAAFLIGTATFKSAGGFGSMFFLLKEDSDLAVRLAHRKSLMTLNPAIEVIHQVSSTIKTLGPLKSRLATRNAWFSWYRNVSFIEAILSLPALLLQTILALGWHTVVRGNPAAAVRGLFEGAIGGFRYLNSSGRFFTLRRHPLGSPLMAWTKRLRSGS